MIEDAGERLFSFGVTNKSPGEHERLIDHVIHSSAYHDAKDFIGAVLQVLAEDLDGAAATKAHKLEIAQAERISFGGMTVRQLCDESHA